MNRWVFFFWLVCFSLIYAQEGSKLIILKCSGLCTVKEVRIFESPQTTPCSDFICPVVLLAFFTQVWKILVTTMGYN